MHLRNQWSIQVEMIIVDINRLVNRKPQASKVPLTFGIKNMIQEKQHYLKVSRADISKWEEQGGKMVI